MSEAGSIVEVRLCATQDVPIRQGKVVRVGDRPLAVFNTDEGFRVIDNTCTHMGGTLADGLVADATVACPLHDRRFSLATGRAVGHDCGSVSAYPVEVRDDAVYVSVPVFTFDEDETVVGGASVDDEVTDEPQDNEVKDQETAPVAQEERGEGADAEDSSDTGVNNGDAQDPEKADYASDGDHESDDSHEVPAEAERPIEAKAGLREA